MSDVHITLTPDQIELADSVGRLQPVEIKLTWTEVYRGAIVGVMRRITSIREGLNAQKHAEKSDWATDIDGACSELAVAKWRGVYWAGTVNSRRDKKGVFKAPDLGLNIQVRSTCAPSGHLILRPNDYKDGANHVYVLVISDCPFYSIIGWLEAIDARRREFLRLGKGGESDAWWVPQDYLHDISTLVIESATKN